MATSLGDLLDLLADTGRTVPDSAFARADAGTALGHLGRALSHLKRAGVSAVVADPREQRTAALAVACTALAARAPITDGRLTTLAAAAADTLAVLDSESTAPSRWAATVAITDTVEPLAAHLQRRLPAGPAAAWVAEIQRHALAIQRDAARNPPTAHDATLLDRPIPPSSAATGNGPDVVDATAMLVHVTRPAPEPMPLAEFLAATMAAQMLCEAAQPLRAQPTPSAAMSARSVTAANAWQVVREALQPFNDGSRRPQLDEPPIVGATRHLHRILTEPHNDSPPPVSRRAADIAAAALYLPSIAGRLLRAVETWGRTETLLAYAWDLPQRELRLDPYLAGHHQRGIVRADGIDLLPVSRAVRNAELLCTELASDVRHPVPDIARTRPSTNRIAAAHRARLAQPETPEQASAAKEQAYQQLRGAQRHRAMTSPRSR